MPVLIYAPSPKASPTAFNTPSVKSPPESSDAMPLVIASATTPGAPPMDCAYWPRPPVIAASAPLFKASSISPVRTSVEENERRLAPQSRCLSTATDLPENLADLLPFQDPTTQPLHLYETTDCSTRLIIRSNVLSKI